MRTEDRRRQPRVFAEVEVAYTHSKYAAETASVSRNLGPEGICLPLRIRFEVGVHLKLRIDLPGEFQPILALGQIVWIRLERSGAGSAYEAGLRFTQIDPLDRRRLLKFMTALQPNLSS